MTITLFARSCLLTVSVGLGAVAVSACTSGPAVSVPVRASAAGTSSASAARTPPVVTTTASPPGTPSPSAAALAQRAAAEAAWKQGSEASSAERGGYLQHAAADLSAAKTLGVADPADYASAIAALHQIEAVPETDVTAAQMAIVRTDTIALDSFFGTPGLYGFPAS